MGSGTIKVKNQLVPFVIASLLCAGGVQAQEEKETGLQLGASVTGTYSDNYLRLAKDEAPSTPNGSKSDFIIDSNVFLGWRQRVGRQMVWADVDVGRRLHTKNTVLDKTLLASAVGMDWQVGARCDGTLEISYDRTQGDFESIDDVVNNVRKSRQSRGDLACGGPGRSNIVAGGYLDDSKNTAPSRALNDSNAQNAYFGLGYKLGIDDSIDFVVRKTWRQYENRLTALGNEDRNVQTDYAVEVQKGFGPRLTIDGWAGHSKINERDETEAGFSGFSGRLGVNYDLAGRHLINVSVFRELETAQTLVASFVRKGGIAGSLRSNLGPRLSLTADFERSRRNIEIREEFLELNLDQNERDVSTLFALGGTYKIGRSLEAYLRGRFSKRNADVDGFDYSEKAVIFGIRYSYN